MSPGGPHGGDESEDDKLEDFKSKFEEDTPQEDMRHGRPIDPLGPTPVPIGGPRYTAAGNNYSLKQGQQDKHIEGTNNFTEDKSILADPNPQSLLDEFAGRGQPANAIPAGQPGYRERVDFGRIIGQFFDERTKKLFPTSKGIVHYGKNGAHIVPSEP
ncbi:toxin 50 [Methylocapsa palsarum]|uniref:Toxin 50 n=1 Tax=Methylocapsa palsarum TaxID=1612308 RepID=A0A1I3WV25_9HYPH|nr:toxin 50 [Methylocapsa palsarum]